MRLWYIIGDGRIRTAINTSAPAGPGPETLHRLFGVHGARMTATTTPTPAQLAEWGH